MNKRIEQLVRYELTISTEGEDINHINKHREECYKNIGKQNIHNYFITGKKDFIRVYTAEMAMRAVIRERIYNYLCTMEMDEEHLSLLIDSWLFLNPTKNELEAFISIVGAAIGLDNVLDLISTNEELF